MEYYDVGKSKEGADAYPPLMLLKWLLLQKWFHIPSDPELEDQIPVCCEAGTIGYRLRSF